MKTLFRILLVQLCCIPLCLTDAMARDAGKSKDERSGSRPSVRPSKSESRNPITQSKSSKATQRPSAKPAARPETRPQKPINRPQAKPAERPKVPERPQTKPAERPNRPDARPDKPSERPNRPDARPDKPSERPNRPDARPDKPSERPNRPDARPDKPSERPNRPDARPDKPSERPNLPNRPNAKPGKPADRPDLPYRPHKPQTRPEAKPGNVKYPRPETLPATNKRPGDKRPAIDTRPNRKPEVKPGKNTRPVRKPQFNHNEVNINNKNTVNQKNVNKNWWSSNKNSNNRTTVVNNNTNIYRGDTNVRINNNFKNNVNWSTHQKNWGYNPWWNRPATRPWYGGSWNCGWNNNYYRSHHHVHTNYYGGYRPPGYVVYEDHDNDVAQAIGWGLVGWGLGKLVFDSGYQTYSNPYPAQPVPSSKGSSVTYTQPITVVAAQTAPPEEETEKITELSESHIAASQEAFKQGDYLKALEAANRAVAEAPGDGALHEYRALVLFALGKYSEAAGVLNPVLAGGPGWDWTTMIGLYNSQETYMTQLDGLQKYSDAKPDAADAKFLLGYHYMVCGHLEEASAEFEDAARLQPADSVSAQLRDLTKASSNNGDAEAEEPAPTEDAPPPPAPVPLEKLTGTWVSDKGDQGTVTLAFKDDGKFIWTFTKAEKSNEFGGEYSMNDNGLLVLDADESQMVASVDLPQDNQLKFVLSGGPPGDPGLVFAKK